MRLIGFYTDLEYVEQSNISNEQGQAPCRNGFNSWGLLSYLARNGAQRASQTIIDKQLQEQRFCGSPCLSRL